MVQDWPDEVGVVCAGIEVGLIAIFRGYHYLVVSTIAFGHVCSATGVGENEGTGLGEGRWGVEGGEGWDEMTRREVAFVPSWSRGVSGWRVILP